jgi:MoaA/NifB/PqqE/SkfB family radical SAM enzyme
MINLDKADTNPESILNRINLILEKDKPPFDYGNILLKYYNQHLVSYFNGENPPPYEIEIQPSSKCNANCSHCWAKNFSRLEDKIETRENADLIINRILNFKQDNFPLPKIKFCGSTGDPLMNPIIDYIIDKFYGKRWMRLFTNGIKIGQNKDDYNYINSLSKLNSIYLSLDAGTTDVLWKVKKGAREKKVDIEDILEGAKRIKESGNTSIDVSYVITKENYTDISEAARKSKEYNLNLIRYRIDQ